MPLHLILRYLKLVLQTKPCCNCLFFFYMLCQVKTVILSVAEELLHFSSFSKGQDCLMCSSSKLFVHVCAVCVCAPRTACRPGKVWGWRCGQWKARSTEWSVPLGYKHRSTRTDILHWANKPELWQRSSVMMKYWSYQSKWGSIR